MSTLRDWIVLQEGNLTEQLINCQGLRIAVKCRGKDVCFYNYYTSYRHICAVVGMIKEMGAPRVPGHCTCLFLTIGVLFLALCLQIIIRDAFVTAYSQ